MKRLAGVFVLTYLCSAFAVPDLVAPFTVDLLSSKHAVWDSILITTYLQNKGTTTAYSPLYPTGYTSVSLGVDSFNIRSHSTTYLMAGYFLEYKDTMTVMKGPFAINTWIDPLRAWGEGASDLNNNVRAQAYNFHPQIKYDTVTIIEIDTLLDTVELWDTLKVTVRDTVKVTETVQVRDTITITKYDTTIVTKTDTLRFTKVDTVRIRDTLKVCDPTKASAPTAKARALRPLVRTDVYTLAGQLVWAGELEQGGYPKYRFKPGRYVAIQGTSRRLLEVRYK